MNSECYQIGELLINVGTQEVSLDGVAVPMPPLSFQLLHVLARHAPNVVTLEQLEEEVWNGLVVDRATINKRVVLVRNSLREAGSDGEFITVVRGTGYRIAVPVQPVTIDSNEPPPVPETSDYPAGPGGHYRWVAAVLVVLAIAAVFYFTNKEKAPGSESAETRNIVAVDSADVEAYGLYLKGRELMDNRIQLGASSIREAAELFREAIELDQGLVKAHVGMAAAYFLLPSYDPGFDRAKYFDKAEASARYALELDPDASDAHGVLGAIKAWRGDPGQAAAHYTRARELGNRDPDIVHWQAMLFLSMGYFDNQVPFLEEAFKMDPGNNLLGCSLASALNLRGEPDAAMKVLNDMDSFSRRDLGIALAAIYNNEFELARQMLRGIELREGALPDYYADLLVAAFEEEFRFASVEEEFVSAAQNGALNNLVAFEALVIMGSTRAFDLEVDVEGTVFEHRLPEPVWNNWSVNFRKDPRFKAWVRKLGYEQYWRAHGWPDRCKPTSLEDFECV